MPGSPTWCPPAPTSCNWCAPRGRAGRLRTKASTLSRTRATTSSTTSATATSICQRRCSCSIYSPSSCTRFSNWWMGISACHLLQFPARVLGRGALRLPAVSVQLVGSGAGAHELAAAAVAPVSGPLVAARSCRGGHSTSSVPTTMPRTCAGRCEPLAQPPHPESARFAPAAVVLTLGQTFFPGRLPLTENWSIDARFASGSRV